MSDDWMARPGGRFLIWFVYMAASLGVIGMLLGFLQLVDWSMMWLTGSKTTARIIGFLCLMSLVATFNAWIWTATPTPPIEAV